MSNISRHLRLIIPLLAFFVMVPAWAQNYAVTGQVKDAAGDPVIGANILVKGTGNGTITDFDGRFSLNVQGTQTLVVTSIGYKTQEILIKAKQNLVILLEEDNALLDEVVVIGYGQVKKQDATGAVTAIRPNTLNRVKMTTTTDLLMGKIAGLQVTQGSGAAGQSGTVRIRQGASLNASNSPLIVIDGMVDASLSSINPEDIESINVLKDASASAIYGARGANGVIIVTTKKGPNSKRGQAQKAQVAYRGDFSVNQNYQYLDVYSADEFRHEYARRGWDTSLLGNASTDWQKEITRTAFTQKHTVSVKGAIPYVPYRVSIGFQEEQGTIIGNKQDLGTVTVNLTPKFFDDHLSLDLSMKDTYKYAPEYGGSISSAATKDPTWPIYADYGPVTINGTAYDKKGSGYYMYGADAQGNGADPNAANVVAEAKLPGTGYDANNRFVTNAMAVYKVHGFEDLTATFSFNGNYYKSHSVNNSRNNTPSTWGTDKVKLEKGGLGKNSKSDSYARHYTFDYYLNYKHEFGKHNIDATAGHSYESKYSDYWNSPTYWNDGELVNGSIESSGNSKVNLSSWFGRLNYIFNNKYLFTFTMRSDASSRFAPETRWGYFPSAALAWKLNEEKFIKDLGFVEELKLRVSYGKTGQQEIGNDYAYQASYYASDDVNMYREGNTFYTTYRPAAFNRAIQWEVTTTKNIGLDFGFFNNRFNGSIDYYDRYTDNLLMSDVKVAAGSNFAEVADQNIGEMASRGLEITLSGTPVVTKDWMWTVSGNLAWNSSTIKKLTSYEDPNAYIKTGEASSNRYMQIHKVGDTPYTYYLAKQAYDENGKPLEKFINPAYDPSDPNSQEFVSDDSADASKWDTGKSSLAPFYGGFSTQIKYKKWDIGMNGHFAFGHYVFWKTMYSGSNSSFFNSSYQFPTNTYKDVVPEWEKEHYYSDYWLHKGDYLKIDNIVVGYTFDRPFKGIDSARLSLGVQNIATFSSYPGLDPEVYNGLDGSSTPRARQFMLSLSIDL